MKYPLLAAILAAGLLSTGCSREAPANAAPPPIAKAVAPEAASAPAPVPPAVNDTYAELMRVVFGSHYRPAKGNALADMTDPDDRRKRLPMVVTGVGSTRLPTGETVLAVNGEMADSDGEPQSGHSSSGLLSLYLLDQREGRWQVRKRHESVASLGSFGQLGELKWVNLTKDKIGLAVLHGGTWQGQTITLLALFDPLADKVVDLVGESIPVYSGNDGACGPSTATCWEAEAQWHFEPGSAAYDDLLLAITGYEDNAKHPDAEPKDEDEAIERVRKSLNANVRYVYDGKRYQLRDGTNTIPGI